MSRTRVVEGVDERGRPRTRWAESTAAETHAYGFMEPAYASVIERRQASPAELAAARAREADPDPLRPGPLIVKAALSQGDAAARLQQSRMNGAARHVEVMAAKAPHQPEPSQEETVAEAGQILSTGSPGLENADADADLDPFVALSGAALAAQQAREQMAIAEVAWSVARQALTDAMAACMEIVDPEPVTVSLGDAMEATHVPAIAPEPIGGGPAAPTKQDLTLDAVLRHRGDLKAVAGELHTSPGNVTATLHNAGKRHRLTVAHLDVLPASFAKYMGV